MSILSLKSISPASDLYLAMYVHSGIVCLMRRVQKLGVFSIGLSVKICGQWQESKTRPSCYGFTYLKWWTMLAYVVKSHLSFQNFLTIRIIYINMCVYSVISRINSSNPCAVACHAPLSMGFPRQEHWSGLPLHPPENLPDPGIECLSPVSAALAGRFFTPVLPKNPHYIWV